MRRLNILMITTLFMIFIAGAAFANNIRVENVAFYKAADQPANTIDIKFDVLWDNPVSGTDGNSQAFFDRAWVFVKYWNDDWDGSTLTQGWAHATLTTGGTLTTYSASTNTGLSADGKGAFASPGVNQTVRWNYSGDGILSSDTVKVRVMAIEMVYIPQGSFYVGDGTTSSVAGQFRDGATNTPFQITGEGQLTLGGTAAGNLANNNASGMFLVDDFNDTTSQTLLATFPKGFNAFYIMKYEISQGQYRDFLNMLSRAQQNKRTASQTASKFVMSNNSSVVYRQGIRAPASIPSGAITFGCDLNANGTFNEDSDGEWIACNYLNWMHTAAYIDWACLRPMTELEFEKAARGGGVTAVANEYAWGNTTIDYFSDLTDAGKISEAKGPTRPNANCNYGSASPSGPVRCGMFATSSSTRQQAGASYYGVMGLSGNLPEKAVTVGNSTGRGFTGTHGDGTLTTTSSYEGNATNTDWPGIDATPARGVTGTTGIGERDTNFITNATYARVSHRSDAAREAASIQYLGGNHAVRTSP